MAIGARTQSDSQKRVFEKSKNSIAKSFLQDRTNYTNQNSASLALFFEGRRSLACAWPHPDPTSFLSPSLWNGSASDGGASAHDDDEPIVALTL